MKGILTSSQIDYVLFHLQQHVDLPAELKKHFSLGENSSGKKIVFNLSANDLNLAKVFPINDVPNLFPMGTEKHFYYFDENGSLIFCHDILKSIFYLLSGYQEFANQESRDKLGRFSYEDSIQSTLKFIEKPIVNYYFQILAEALGEFSKRHNISLTRRRLFSNFGFFLSHDIDYVDQYTYNYFVYKLKEVSGVRPSRLSAPKNIQLFIRGLKSRIAKENPFWNFEYLRAVERNHNFRSAFFFLDQGVLHSDAYYSFEEPRMKNLFSSLLSEGCEIGIHGPVRSGTDQTFFKQAIEKIETAAKTKVIGARQHRLLWSHPLTAKIEQSLGIKYDSTLGFAAHEGFRNSYCYPFRLFDFENDKMLDIWEVPLNLMDVTLFSYRNFSPGRANEACENVLKEIKKFGGVLTLNWHNSFFDEDTYPGVTSFYESLLRNLEVAGAANVLGFDLVQKVDNLHASRK